MQMVRELDKVGCPERADEIDRSRCITSGNCKKREGLAASTGQ
jgi:hypothetical protein